MYTVEQRMKALVSQVSEPEERLFCFRPEPDARDAAEKLRKKEKGINHLGFVTVGQCG